MENGLRSLNLLSPVVHLDHNSTGLDCTPQQSRRSTIFLENAVLGGQILVPQQELLIDRSCDVGEHACPNHLVASPPLAKDRSSRFAGEPRDYHAG
jgi:hypothetical protein